MKCLEQRPAATVSSKLIVERVEGGWVVRVTSMAKGEKFYEGHKIIAKSIYEVVLLMKEWASPYVPIQGEETNDK